MKYRFTLNIETDNPTTPKGQAQRVLLRASATDPLVAKTLEDLGLPVLGIDDFELTPETLNVDVDLTEEGFDNPREALESYLATIPGKNILIGWD